MVVSRHQYGGGTSSVWWRVCNTDVQYRTTKTAQGVRRGCIYLGK